MGNVLPGGTGWATDKFDILGVKVGRPRTVCAMPIEELATIVEALGGIRAAAKKANCGDATMSRLWKR